MMSDDRTELFPDDDEEYVSEEDIAEENGFWIDDDGNWIEIPEEIEAELYLRRRPFMIWDDPDKEPRMPSGGGGSPS